MKISGSSWEWDKIEKTLKQEFKMREITKEELLEENLRWLEENIDWSDGEYVEKTGKQLDDMMKYTDCLEFKSEEEKMEYLEWCKNTDFFEMCRRKIT